MPRYDLSNAPKERKADDYACYYRAIIEVMESENEIKIVLESESGKKKHIKITKNGFFLNKSGVALSASQSRYEISDSEGNFERLFNEALRKRGVESKYRNMLNLAKLTDDSGFYNAPIIIYVDTGNGGGETKFLIATVMQTPKYKLGDREISESEARKFFSKYYDQIILQLKTSIENAKSYADNQNRQRSSVDNSNAKVDGIEVSKKNGKIRINPTSILGKEKREGEKLSDDEKQVYQAVKDIIFAKSTRGYVED